MPSVEFLFQNSKHGQQLHEPVAKHVLSLPAIEQAILSIAYVRNSGVLKIEPELKKSGKRTTAYVGIDNGITSVQGIEGLLRSGVEIYGIDTGAPDIIYHPKVYFAKNKQVARAMVGSSNLTRGGLESNFEFACSLEADLTIAADVVLADSITAGIVGLPKTYPANVFTIDSVASAKRFAKNGKLEDEAAFQPRMKGASSRSMAGGKVVPRIFPRAKAPAKSPMSKIKPIIGSQKAAGYQWLMVWESNPLSERDLNIPSGKTTHATGSMGLKKGRWTDIDHRHYFKDSVFKNLLWTPDPKAPHLLRAQVPMEILIAGIFYGQFQLQLTHNTDTKSASYKQNNFMTHLIWGPAREFVARRQLLGATARLFENRTKTGVFLLEIA